MCTDQLVFWIRGGSFILRVGRPMFDSLQGQWMNFFLSSLSCPDQLWDPPNLPSSRCRVLSPGGGGGRLKRQGHEGDHSPQYSAEVNAWSCASTLQYVFMVWCLIKQWILTGLKNWLWTLSWYYSGIRLEVLTKTMINLRVVLSRMQVKYIPYGMIQRALSCILKAFKHC
jgi:hypothetical protein